MVGRTLPPNGVHSTFLSGHILKVLVTQSCLTLLDPILYPRNSPGKNTGVGSHSLLQGIFPIEPLPILKRLTHLKITATKLNDPESNIVSQFNDLRDQVRDAFIFKHTYDIETLSAEEVQNILDKNRTFLLQAQHYFEQEKLIALVKDL